MAGRRTLALLTGLLWIVVCGGHGAAAAPVPKAGADAGPAGARQAPRVLYIGDSIALESQDTVGQWVRAGSPAEFHSVPHSGMTLCDYLEGRPESSFVPAQDKAAALVRSLRPDVVILQFWGHSWGFTPCMNGAEAGSSEYYARYRADIRAVTDQITEAAAAAGAARPKLVWVLQGPDAFNPDRVRQVNALYTAQAAAAGDLVSDAGHHVSMAAYPYENLPRDRYAWTQYLPCDAYERAHPEYCTEPQSYGGVTRLHRDDDPLHYCLAPTTQTSRGCGVPSPGVLRYGRAIASTVTDHLADAAGTAPVRSR
ncbi:SGNH/GDSL hydrolase family protein [Streptomyces sp. NPDC018031]|uniref:SGNH/GDSL hydrolase family protein n=1 Tax=Streptomyces sp. NPDC018031 TaxID=3365033 RepID=UPI003788A64E